MLLLTVGLVGSAFSLPESGDERGRILGIEVSGNLKVEKDALIQVMSNKEGEYLNEAKVAEDISNIYNLGYFSDIRIYKKKVDKGYVLFIEVVEKPAILKISFSGMEHVKEEDCREKLSTKLYTLVNESVLNEDVSMISKQYFEKGYYLVDVSYRVDIIEGNEAEVVFVVDEGNLIKVSTINILGNKYFSDSDLMSKMMLRSSSRSTNLPISSGGSFQDEFLKRDAEFIAFYYRDHGFIEVQVSSPIVELDPSRESVSITMEITEGIQYRIGNIDVSMDLLFTEEELKETIGLKSGEIFKITQFQKSVENLVTKYGDLGYAFCDVDVKRSLNKDDSQPTIDLDYVITKGEKAYFGSFDVTGNVKTRDNVVRRELEVFDSELYSDTGIKKSEENIKRLGFFEEVKLLRKIDSSTNTLSYTVQVKEKPTGQLQASVAFQPSPSGRDSSWYVQGAYSDSNHFGRGWQTSLNIKWGGVYDYNLGFDFFNPKLNDGDWNFGVGASTERSKYDVTADTSVDKRVHSVKLSLGRRIIELIRGSISYKISKIGINDSFLIGSVVKEGISSSVSFTLSRNGTNNYLEPSEGSYVSLKQSIFGGMFGGDFDYYETSFNYDYYYPIDFTETYRTYFRIGMLWGWLYPMSNEMIPISERYKMGGPADLRGYDYMKISPTYNVMRSPEGGYAQYPKGGNRKILLQTEYFFPLIREAGLKGILFHDIGRVYDDNEKFTLSGMYQDVGFGLRWNTPMAPFRFEFAYPIEDGKLKDMKFVFYLGY